MGALRGIVTGFAAEIAAAAITFFARLVTAVRGVWAGIEPVRRQRIYYANHVSHGDFVLVWTVLPERLRRRTRPVAGADYWLASPVRRFIGRHVFNAVLIDRNPETRTLDPVEQMAESLDGHDSLILFPEGTRNTTDDALLPFKSGIFRLARARPGLRFVPVWVDFRVDRYLKGSGPTVFSGFDPVSVIFSDIEDAHAGDFDRAQFAGAGGACGALFEDPRGQYWVAAANLIDGNYRLSIPSVIAKGTGPSDPAIVEALAAAGVAPAAAGQGVPSTADRSTAPIVLSALALMLVGSARALTSKPAGRGRAR